MTRYMAGKPEEYPTSLGKKPKVEQEGHTVLGHEEGEVKDPTQIKALGESDPESGEPDYPTSVSVGKGESEESQ